MPGEDDAELEAPESPPKADAKPDAPRRRASDQDEPPAWFTRWTQEQAAKSKPDDSEDDGILSIEELPDLEDVTDAVENAVDKGKELVESIPERTHWLFGKLGGKKE
jgi:hypothetical protein